MRRLAALWFVLLGGVPALAFNEPPVNLGATTFLDGGPYAPGHYLISYIRFINGNRALDQDGRTIPGSASISASVMLNQYVFVAPAKAAGGHPGFTLLLPLVTASAKGRLGAVPATANTGGLGDLNVGPFLQWNDSTLFGLPFAHRFELDWFFPTGKYDNSFLVNPGSNIYTFEPFYAFTWKFSRMWETSWRLHYTWNDLNKATGIQPGQMFHANYAFSREVTPTLRLGVSGYVLQQTTDDRISGVSTSGTKERGFAAGPGLFYATPSVLFFLNHQFEAGLENRLQGTRTTFELVIRF